MVRKSILQLPTEVLLYILMHIQPFPNKRILQKHAGMCQKIPKTLLHRNHREAMPELLVFGQVCRRFRQVQALHPFWFDLAWHHLLPNSAIVRNISNFFALMAKNPIQRQIRHLTLDLIHHRFQLEPSVLIEILAPIFTKLRSIYIHAQWDLVAHKELLRIISRLKLPLESLTLVGHPSNNILCGINSEQLRSFKRHLPSTLQSLSLESYGMGGFTFTDLMKFVSTQPMLSSLCIWGIADWNLDILSCAAPSLTHLCIGFRDFHEACTLQWNGLLNLPHLDTLSVHCPTIPGILSDLSIQILQVVKMSHVPKLKLLVIQGIPTEVPLHLPYAVYFTESSEIAT